MNIDSLKTLILGLINNQMNAEKIASLTNTEVNDEASIFEGQGMNEENSLEQIIGDAFANCDANGDGEINNSELQSISSALSSISAMTGVSINGILGIESEDQTVEVLTQELSNLEAGIPSEISESSIPTEIPEAGIPTEVSPSLNPELDAIKKKENELTDIILNDELISDEIKEQRVANQTALSKVSARIAELEEKNGNLTPEELAELQSLTAQETKLKEEAQKLENEILKNCTEETKNAIDSLNQLKDDYNKLESGEVQIPENTQPDDIIEVPDETPTTNDSTSNVGDNSYSNDYSNNTNNTNNTNNQNNTTQSYDNMSLEKLQSELKTENGNLSKAQEELAGILDGSNSELTALKGTITEKEEALNELLNTIAPELASELSAVQEEKDNQEKLIGEKETEISQQESTINSCQRNYDNAVSAVSNQESIISNLEALVGDAEGENKEIISQAIQVAKTELESLKTARDNAQNELKAQKEKLDILKGELQQLQQDLNPIIERENAVNEKIAALNNEEVNAAKADLDKANKEYETKKTALETAAKETIASTEKKITEIEAAITTQTNNKAKNDYGLTNMKGTYNLNGKEYNTILDGANLSALENKIQSGGAGNKWGHPDKCLSFAYSYGQWIDGSTNTPINGKAAEYPDAGAYTAKYGTHDEVLSMVKDELDAGRPVVLQVNGKKDGSSRHYVTVVGYSSTAGDKLTESDLLILDTYDGKIEGMGDNGSRFMISGKQTGRDYDYQIYIRK